MTRKLSGRWNSTGDMVKQGGTDLVATRASRVKKGWVSATIAAAAFILLVGSLAAGIIADQAQTRAHSIEIFQLRGQAYAGFVSTYLAQQADRQIDVAQQSLTSGVSAQEFDNVTEAFGSNAAVLLDRSGRLLDLVPNVPAKLGADIASHYSHLAQAETGRIAISNVVPSAARGLPVVAIAVPFNTAQGRRVFSVAYQAGSTALGAFVDHVVPYRLHEVFLVDGVGRIVASSPNSSQATLAKASPGLARARVTSDIGTTRLFGASFIYNTTKIVGTPWHLIVAVPSSQLLASSQGWNDIVPWLAFSFVAVLSLVVVLLLMWSLESRRRLGALSDVLAQTARTDALSGLSNRRDLVEQLETLTANSRRHGFPLTIVMIDIDHFKDVNDRFGHGAGDSVIVRVADCMRLVFRTGDVFGRWGGDEFLAVLPMTDQAGGLVVAERLRQAVVDRPSQCDDTPIFVNLSIGCTTGIGHVDELVRMADVALYQAKTSGRGQVATSHAPSLT
jgi:diguanylate cyclase (GGDEF)-like protein